MKCPACKNPLREKSAGDLTLDLCYGGCGGIWFDASELERVDARAAATLHTVWQIPADQARANEPRLCPRCPDLILERKWFSELKQVEIDQCTHCNGIWLDAGEFTRIYEESKRAKVLSPVWLAALELIASSKEPARAPGAAPHA
jgi:uncharacterized protein